MKRFGIISFVLITIVVSLLMVRRPQPAFADQDGKPKGQLQGKVVDSEGDPIFNYENGPLNDSSGRRMPIRLFLNGEPVRNGEGGYVYSFPIQEEGFYRIPNLKPGLYEVWVYPKNNDERPQRFLGVLIKSGEQARLDIKFNKGKAIEVVGKPLINIPPAIIVSEELEKLHKEIDELKKVIEELKKK